MGKKTTRKQQNRNKQNQSRQQQLAKAPVIHSKANMDSKNKPNGTSSLVEKMNFVSLNNTTISLKPSGLPNMGNTCYFNSVMQVLGQTYILNHTLLERSIKDFSWNARTFYLKEKSGKNFFASENIQVSLPPPASLVQAFLQLQSEIFQQKTTNPRSLLSEIRRERHQFEGWAQQDAQELLISLLDSLKKVEMARQVKALIQGLNIQDPKNASEDDKNKANCYKITAKHTVLDAIFGGQLLSIIHCTVCDYRSFTFEPFIDISLPLQCNNDIQSKIDNLISQNSSKGKKSKKQNKNCKNDIEKAVDSDESIVEDQIEENDVKNLTAKERKKRRQEKKAARRQAKKLQRENAEKEQESLHENIDSNDDENDDNCTQEENLNEKTDDVVADKTTHSNANCVLAGDESNRIINEQNESTDNDFNSNQTKENNSSQENSLQEPKSKVHELDNKEDSSENKLNCTTGSVKSDSSASKSVDENGCEQSSSSDSDDNNPSCLSQIQKDFRYKFYTFVHQRMCYSDSEFDNKDLGGLFRSFIKEEFLDGANKYLCENCSKLNGNKKTYSKAIRCQLIALPPPVLILHLKRFEASGGFGRRMIASMHKLNTKISFPEKLHLSPYTSRIYEYFSKFYEPECDPFEISEDNEHRLEYTLYGVVIHSGSLRCGHYMAYVCVRPGSFHSNSLRRFLHLKPFVSNIEHILSVCYEDCRRETDLESINLNGENLNENIDETNNAEEAVRKWYFISDSSVSPTTLDAVLRDTSSPYLLFYERTG